MTTSRRSRLALLSVVCTIAAAAAAPPGASAASQRYASPTGIGGACSDATPCALQQAIVGSSAGDEVIVGPGTYGLGTQINAPSQITIHGIAGQPRPVVKFSGLSQLALQDSALRYVELEHQYAGTVVASWGSKLDQVVVKGAIQAECAVAVYNTTIRNSIVVARDPIGSAICAGASHATNTSTFRNVTAIARDGAAIEAYAEDSTANSIVNVINVIAKAGPAGAGLEARTVSPGAHATLTATHTNYFKSWTYGSDAAVVNGGGNQGASPAFVNEAAGDYRQKAGAVTIDAGHYDPMNGAFDLDGDLRNVGSPDIGADEFVAAPTASTGPAGAVTEGAATLTGSVNAKGSPTSYQFEYGPTTAYGAATSASDAGSGVNAVAASASVTGLSPATTYHYRVVASNSAGVAQGGDQTFTTAPASPATPILPASPAGTFAGVKLVSARLTLRGRFITVKLTCPAGASGRCTGTTRLSAKRRRTSSRAAARVALGRAGFSIAAGQRATVKVRVSRAGRRLFAHSRRLRGRAASAARSASGQSKTTVAAVTIRKRTA
jgi:hypothetical protein